MKHETNDAVNHPAHYQSANGECIDLIEHSSFCQGNAVKYLWRAGLKSDSIVQDLSKALWYCHREIARLEKMDAEGFPDRRVTDFKPFELTFTALFERLNVSQNQALCESWRDVINLIEVAKREALVYEK